MTLREALGGDARRIHELVDQLLDSEDSLIVLIDERRAISYGEGLGLSPCHIELITVDMERAVRAVAGNTPRQTSGKRTSEDLESAPDGDHRRLALRGLPEALVWRFPAIG